MKDIKVLGGGCRNCRRLEEHIRVALDTLGMEATITKVTDMNEIADYGVFATPAMVVDGEVMVSGRVATPEEVQALLTAGV